MPDLKTAVKIAKPHINEAMRRLKLHVRLYTLQSCSLLMTVDISMKSNLKRVRRLLLLRWRNCRVFERFVLRNIQPTRVPNHNLRLKYHKQWRTLQPIIKE